MNFEGDPNNGSLLLDQWQYNSMGVYLAVVGFFATTGNIMVIILMVHNRNLQKRGHNLLLLNLAISDLGISIFGYPWTTAASFAGRWLIGDIGCIIYGFTCTTFALTDINTLLAISFYRYMVVCKPHLHYRMNSKSTIMLLIGSCWGYSLLWSLSALLGWCNYEYESFGTSCSMDWNGQTASDVSYTVLMTLFCYVSHIIGMVYFYYKINQHSAQMFERFRQKESMSVDDAVLINKLRAERKLTIMSLVMVGVFTIIWSPYAWVAFWSMIQPEKVPDWLMTWPTMFAKSSCMMNPIIYYLTNKNFKVEAYKFFCGCRLGAVHDERINALQNRKTPIEQSCFQWNFQCLLRARVRRHEHLDSLPSITQLEH